MLTRPGVSRPRPKASKGQGQKPQGQGQKSQGQGQGQRSRLRSNSIVMACNCCLVQNSINPQQYLATHYGGTSDAGIPVYGTVSVIIPWYTVFGRILVTLILALALNEAKARNTRSRPKASRPRPQVSRPRPENLASRPRSNNPDVAYDKTWSTVGYYPYYDSSDSHFKSFIIAVTLAVLSYLWHANLAARRWTCTSLWHFRKVWGTQAVVAYSIIGRTRVV